jgi:hypothetical protein
LVDAEHGVLSYERASHGAVHAWHTRLVVGVHAEASKLVAAHTGLHAPHTRSEAVVQRVVA